MDVAALADLLHETAEHHGAFEAVAPPHDWWDWYAAYMRRAPEREQPRTRPPRPPTATWRRSSRSVVTSDCPELHAEQPSTPTTSTNGRGSDSVVAVLDAPQRRPPQRRATAG